MNDTIIDLRKLPQWLFIGYATDNAARPQVFDFSSWVEEYGAGTLELNLQRPGDEVPYPVTLSIEGTTATWTPSSEDTKAKGQGMAQFVYTVGGTVAHTAILRVLIGGSLGAGEDAPNGFENWFQKMQVLAAAAADSADASAASASAAAGSATAANESAQDAEDVLIHISENIEQTVDDWLTAHPEATTTVQDGAITIPKLAEDVAETIQPLTALSESDGAANTALLNELLATKDVKLKPGTYPLHGTVTVDGVTLDLNGATLFRDEYISGEAIFIIKGTDPCIKNGTIVGTYDGSTSGSETGILFQSADDAQLSGLTIKNCRDRGISCDLNEVYGSRVIVRSAADYTSYVHYSADIPVQSGFKFVRTVGGYGFNAVYTVEFVTYIFKDGNGNVLSGRGFPPSFPCPVPQDAATVTVLTRTGAMGIEDGFVPYNIGFTNYNNRCCIRDCTILDCKNWAIANLFGESEICGLYTNCSIDIEDHEGVNLVIKDSRIDASTYVTSFYGRYYNTYFKDISIRAGASHSFVDCSGILTQANASHAYMEPAISLIGGDMLCVNGTQNTDSMDAFNRKSLLITNGVIMTGDWNRINSLFGQNGFLCRQQSFHTHHQVCKGVIRGTIVMRAENPLSPHVSLRTSAGSNLVLYFDRETLSRQNNLIAEGNCYGLHFVNGIVYPNGYTIFDSSFRPQGNNVVTRSANQLLGTYVNCRFDASDYHIIAVQQSDVEISFINCIFDALSTHKLVANNLYAKRMKLNFTNCVFLGVSISTAEDVATYIVSNEDAVVTIDGNVI